MRGAVMAIDLRELQDIDIGDVSSWPHWFKVFMAFAVFAGLTDPNLTGENENFNPIEWGFAEVSLLGDGQLVTQDITYLPAGTVSGTVLNGQGVPS